MTSVRQSMMNVEEDKNKQEDVRHVIKLKDRKSLAQSRQDCNQFINGVRRFSFNFQKWASYQDPWIAERFVNSNSIGFEMDKLPFGKGVERLAFRFQEINQWKELLGNVMVAKESKQINSEFDRERFHMTSMRTQLTALTLANKFSRALETTQQGFGNDSGLAANPFLRMCPQNQICSVLRLQVLVVVGSQRELRVG